MKTKIELVKKAYEWLRISGLTVDPTPEDAVLAVDELEIFMAELDSRNICTNFNFEETPIPATPSGIDKAFYGAAEKGLAVRLAPAFGKEAPMSLMRQATQAISNWAARTATFKQIVPPRTQPRGSGNTFRFPRWIRYYRLDKGAPISCDTLNLKVDEVEIFNIDFSNYLLNGNTITSFNIDIGEGVDLLNSAQNGAVIQIEVKGVSAGSETGTITVTTSIGRINPEKIYFQVSD